MTNATNWDAGAPATPTEFNTWGEAISDSADSALQPAHRAEADATAHPTIDGRLNDLEAADAVIPATVKTASATLSLSDELAIEMDVASANTLTIPPNSSVAFPVGTAREVCQVGAGQTTIVAGAGVTVQTPETLVLTGQWSTVSLRQRATDQWVLAGDVEASA